MITIDGSQGEGGGQVLRTALGLSLVTGRGLQMVNIRAGRKKPGLMRQHLTAARAAAEIGGAEVIGDAIGSQELTFVPEEVRAGEYRFSVGTAGSVTLVFQTVLPALMNHLQNPVSSPAPGSEPWCASKVTFLADAASKHRLLTGSKEFNDLLARDISPLTRFAG